MNGVLTPHFAGVQTAVLTPHEVFEHQPLTLTQDFCFNVRPVGGTQEKTVISRACRSLRFDRQAKRDTDSKYSERDLLKNIWVR